MGEVWAAENVSIGAEVAIKFVSTRCRGGHGVLERFRREALATAQLAHRGIVRVFDLVELEDGEQLAMVMERLRGQSLGEMIRSQGPLTVREAADVLVPVLMALQFAHGRGIIHRDLKPDNIFLHREPDGETIPKLLDFGISKSIRHETQQPITINGEIVGTPMFMSPEQLLGAEVDERSDVYCAGVVLYQCLTGQSPFASDEKILRRARPDQALVARASGVPSALCRVIERAMHVDPTKRYASAAAFAEALATEAPADGRWGAAAAGHTSVLTPPPHALTLPPRRASARASKSTWAAWIAGCAAALSVGVGHVRSLAATPVLRTRVQLASSGTKHVVERRDVLSDGEHIRPLERLPPTVREGG
jgi:serine/threonine-protein kinase